MTLDAGRLREMVGQGSPAVFDLDATQVAELRKKFERLARAWQGKTPGGVDA